MDVPVYFPPTSVPVYSPPVPDCDEPEIETCEPLENADTCGLHSPRSRVCVMEFLLGSMSGKVKDDNMNGDRVDGVAIRLVEDVNGNVDAVFDTTEAKESMCLGQQTWRVQGHGGGSSRRDKHE